MNKKNKMKMLLKILSVHRKYFIDLSFTIYYLKVMNYFGIRPNYGIEMFKWVMKFKLSFELYTKHFRKSRNTLE